MTDLTPEQEEVICLLSADRINAHRVLFKHRHPQQSTPAHDDFLANWYDPWPWLLFMAFRGFAKSTNAEEAIALGACFRDFKNCIIVGENKDRAQERLAAITHELYNNEDLEQTFGNMVGPIDSAFKVVLSNGVCIQAMGKDQALRGVKHLDQRPDFVFGDDMEGRLDARTPEMRKATADWFFRELIPACDVTNNKVRVCGTPLDPESLLMQFTKLKAFKTKIYPIEYLNEEGAKVPLWPERFPQSKIDELRETFTAMGMLREFEMEYLCTAETSTDKTFKADRITVHPVVRTWHNVQGMFDPARTVNKESATTGFAAWSWINNRLVIWDSWARYAMPDEIVEALFQFDSDFSPVEIGVEEDGLNEWLKQPIRHEMSKRNTILPLRAMKAPKGKLDFIKGLQPYFNAGEVVFAKEMPDLKQQLKNFPTGKIDVPNALAYALKMRPGSPYYDSFGVKHIGAELTPSRNATPFLVVNATRSITAAALVQMADGWLRVYADWMREGDATERLSDILKEAQLEAGRTPRLIAPVDHWDKYNNVGLVQAAGKIPIEIRRGANPDAGRSEIRKLMERDVRGQIAFLVDDSARWTLNGLAGGYCRGVDKNGVTAEDPQDNHYSVLFKALEAFAALMKVGSTDDGNGDIQYATTPSGARYMSALRR